MGDLKVGVITGGHTFDVVGFHELFGSLGGIDAYPQALEEWSADYRKYGYRYDVLVFYNMHTAKPEECPGGKRTRAAIDALGTGPGIVVLHHGLLAFKQDPVWDAITGLTVRTIDSYSHDETMRIRVKDRAHPITMGMADFTIVDETYEMGDVDGSTSHVLLTVDHPRSARTIAWTRVYRDVRVFDFQLGHDDQAWTNGAFREVLGRGIGWCGMRDEG